MSIVVFWVQKQCDQVAHCQRFDDTELSDALSFMRTKRTQEGVSHVGMVNEPEGMVGAKDLGGEVKDGRLPSGEPYTWVKRRKA